MPITDFLERNAKIYPNDVALVEIIPSDSPTKISPGVSIAL